MNVKKESMAQAITQSISLSTKARWSFKSSKSKHFFTTNTFCGTWYLPHSHWR